MEAQEQAKLIAWCKAQGLFVRKLTSPSARGFPDVMVGSPNRRGVIFLELKAPAGRLSKPQERTIADLAACGVFVGVPLSFEIAKRLIIKELRLDCAAI